MLRISALATSFSFQTCHTFDYEHSILSLPQNLTSLSHYLIFQNFISYKYVLLKVHNIDDKYYENIENACSRYFKANL